MNNEAYLEAIADAGLGIKFPDSPLDQQIQLGILLDIESILDAGRSLAGPGEARAVVNKKMDALRLRIRNILDGMGKDEARRFLDARGEAIKRQFSI